MILESLATGRREIFSTGQRSFSRLGALSGLIAVFMLLLVAPEIPAQETSKPREDVQTFSIRPQPLSSALETYSRQTGVSFSYQTSVVSEITSPGVQGTYPVAAALREILAGTGVTAIYTSDTTVALEMRTKNKSVEDGPLRTAPIAVRGELIERGIQDSQASAVVLDGETVDIGASVDFSEVLERTPCIINNGGSISIRGIGESPNGVSGERTINVQVDGTTFGVQSRLSSTDFSTWDLEQVDILRGAQSTQTGRNALAGAIIVRSRDPEYSQEARVKLGYASFNTGQAAVALNTPLIDDTVALRFTYDRTSTDGEISTPNPAVDEIDGEENTTTRLGLRWDPTENLSSVLKFSRLEIDRAFPFVDTATLPDFVSTTDFQSQEDSELDSVNLRVTYDFDNRWSLVSSSAFSDFESSGEFPLIGIATIVNETDWFEQKTTLNYVTDKTSAVLGAFYYSENSENLLNAPAIGLGLTVIEDLENYALFSEIEHAFNDRWSVIAGFRYDVEEGTVDEIDAIGTFELIKSSDFSFNAFLPKVGLIYSFDETRSLGFTYQQGYRAGGVGFNRLGGSSEFDPEFTDNLELSFRSEFYDGSLTINANVFYTDWTDRQVRVRNPPFTIPDDNRIANLGSAERYGFELDFRALPTDNLSLYGGFAYSEDESIFPRFDLGENVISDADQRTAVLGGRYDFDDNWYFSGSINHTDSQVGLNERTLVDFQAGFQSDNWLAYLFSTNLLDEDYTLVRDPVASTRGNSRRVGIALELTF